MAEVGAAGQGKHFGSRCWLRGLCPNRPAVPRAPGEPTRVAECPPAGDDCQHQPGPLWPHPCPPGAVPPQGDGTPRAGGAGRPPLPAPHPLCGQGCGRWLWVGVGSLGVRRGKGSVGLCGAFWLLGAVPCPQQPPLHHADARALLWWPLQRCSMQGQGGAGSSPVPIPGVPAQPPAPREAMLRGCPLPGDGVTPQAPVVTSPSSLAQPGLGGAEPWVRGGPEELCRDPDGSRVNVCQPRAGRGVRGGPGCWALCGSTPGGLPPGSAGDALRLRVPAGWMRPPGAAHGPWSCTTRTRWSWRWWRV